MKEPMKYIVAEVSKNWVMGHSDTQRLLCQEFELIINVNDRRGYELHSFQVNRCDSGPGAINETIIAVFVRREEVGL